MSAVNLLGTLATAPVDEEMSTGRTHGSTGARFGDVLAAAGEQLGTVETPTPDPEKERTEPSLAQEPAESAASGDVTPAGSAPPLAAHLRSMGPDMAPAQTDAGDHASDQSSEDDASAIAGMPADGLAAVADAVATVGHTAHVDGPMPPLAAVQDPASAVFAGAEDAGRYASTGAPTPSTTTAKPQASTTSPAAPIELRSLVPPSENTGTTSRLDQATFAPTPETRSTVSGGARDDAGDRVPSPPTSASSAATSVVAASGPVAAVPTAMTVAPVVAEAPSNAHRAVAAQVAPVVVSVAQRPTGTHHLTMTVSPDSLGPVTVRAHISPSGEVQVELSGATDAGRDALRTILIDLRRDLAAVMPHATLSLTHSGSAGTDTNGDRGVGQGSAPFADEQSSGGAGTGRERPGAHAAGRRAELPHIIHSTAPAALGEGLDIFA